MRGSMKKRNKKTAKILAVVLAAALGVCVPETTLQAVETLTSVQIQMPGFVVEQFSAPRLMNVTKNAVVRTLPDNNAAKLTSVTAGNTLRKRIWKRALRSSLPDTRRKMRSLPTVKR